MTDEVSEAPRVADIEQLQAAYLMHLLTPSDTHTVCPFKGTASYWSLAGGPEDIVWAYPEPHAEVAQIKGHFCFYEAELD